VKIISFSWTSAALVCGRKSVTRRQWAPRHAARFKRGDEVWAYDKTPRVGGKPLAIIRLTEDASFQADRDAPDSDWEGEGFAFYWENPMVMPESIYGEPARHSFFSWENFEDMRRYVFGESWVVRFELVSLEPAGAELKRRTEEKIARGQQGAARRSGVLTGPQLPLPLDPTD
jgi:hypothetical protein